jgi:dTMP kinase
VKEGKFITVEGSEGAGKSTNLDYIQQLLRAAGKTVLFTREPGGTPLGEDVRGLLLGHRHTGMSPEAELLLMFAARAEHLSARIRPALARGDWVLCDRFTDASYAYQGGGRGIHPRRIRSLEQLVQEGLKPDLTLLLDVPTAIGLRRAGQRSDPDRFEREETAFFERVRRAYLNIAEQEPGRVKVIDASQSLTSVRQAIRHHVRAFLEEFDDGHG